MSSISLLVVDKVGVIKEQAVKYTGEDELYKKAGFKTAKDFKMHAEWNIENLKDKSYCIRVYGKATGLANQENKYEFPPPIDNVLFFGSVLILNYCQGTPTDISLSEWEAIYEYLFGGFEDIDGNDDEDDGDDDEVDGLPRTKYGYVKDGFVVDDDDDGDEFDGDDEDDGDDDDDDDDDDDEDTVAKKAKAKKAAASKAKSAAKKKLAAATKAIKKASLAAATSATDLTVVNLECTDELVEEEYV